MQAPFVKWLVMPVAALGGAFKFTMARLFIDLSILFMQAQPPVFFRAS
jgi:hypothetical protein